MPELRKDPITGRWVIISTERAKRVTDFARERFQPRGGFCPLCPGNEDRAPHEILAYRNGNGDNGPWTVRVIPNKFPALGIEGNLDRRAEGIYDRMNGIGAHEVIIESPVHNDSFATMTPRKIEEVLWAFRDRIVDLKRDRRFKYILIFKNHGEAAGATLDHPHFQLIALPVVPTQVADELSGSRKYFEGKERCIYCDILYQELQEQVRVVSENRDFLTVTPYAPRFPFETWILPRQHESAFENSPSHLYENLARALKVLAMKADRVLDSPAYNLILHTSPTNGAADNEYYHWHLEFMPKLTKVAGFEWGTGFYINPTPPEEAARYLREAPID